MELTAPDTHSWLTEDGAGDLFSEAAIPADARCTASLLLKKSRAPDVATGALTQSARPVDVSLEVLA